MPIHIEVTFCTPPERIYELLTDAAKFAAVTRQPAEIDAHEGGAFSTFAGMWRGRHIELVPGERMVQAWHHADWDPGVYSIVRLTLIPKGAGTKLVIEQDAYPEGRSPLFPTWHEHLVAGWEQFYVEKLTKYLGGAA